MLGSECWLLPYKGLSVWRWLDINNLCLYTQWLVSEYYHMSFTVFLNNKLVSGNCVSILLPDTLHMWLCNVVLILLFISQSPKTYSCCENWPHDLLHLETHEFVGLVILGSGNIRMRIFPLQLIVILLLLINIQTVTGSDWMGNWYFIAQGVTIVYEAVSVSSLRT